MPSPSGERLLYYASDSQTDVLGIIQLGVVDLERGTFIAFDREGYGDLHEETLGWSGDNTVSLNVAASGSGTRYLIIVHALTTRGSLFGESLLIISA